MNTPPPILCPFCGAYIPYSTPHWHAPPQAPRTDKRPDPKAPRTDRLG